MLGRAVLQGLRFGTLGRVVPPYVALCRAERDYITPHDVALCRVGLFCTTPCVAVED
jgi:hypothetical protein